MIAENPTEIQTQFICGMSVEVVFLIQMEQAQSSVSMGLQGIVS